MSAAQELTEALFVRLDAMLDVPVHDAPPPRAAFPYAVIGPIRSTDWSADDFSGEEHALAVHVWSRYRGAREVRGLMGDVKSALDQVALNVAGRRLILLRFTGAEDFREADGMTRHGIVRFRALTEAIAI